MHRLLALLLLLAVSTASAQVYEVNYTLRFKAGSDRAEGRLQLGRNAEAVREMDFAMPDPRYALVRADGEVRRKGKRVIWVPTGSRPSMVWTVRIDHERKNGGFDNHAADDWVIFRGDDVFPAARVKAVKGARSATTLTLETPKGWHTDTPWIRRENDVFVVDNPERAFDRPTGWMIAGEVGARVERFDGFEVSVAAPKGVNVRRMDMLILLSYALPEMRRAFGQMPPKLLIVQGPDPMWRGGLSGPQSLYLHADRPMVSENATSPVLHELTHSITRIRGKPKGDFIAEGLAEYYGIEILRRSGGISEARFERTREWLKDWGKNVRTLLVDSSKAETTARAVVLFIDLDREIRERTKGKRSLDDVTQRLIELRRVDLADLQRATRAVIGAPAKTLDSPLLR
ncbi:MAG: hypothetical protein MUE46_14700 [Xanthomonadales bacterium]|jgi:hypothetical protein|nr:hypothetical protein [Xanthomonadales bacterium]